MKRPVGEFFRFECCQHLVKLNLEEETNYLVLHFQYQEAQCGSFICGSMSSLGGNHREEKKKKIGITQL